MADVIMPKMGDAMEEGTLLSWKKQDGDSVSVGDIIAEIETDKSNVEVEAEDAGVLRVQAKAGDTVPVGTVIATIGSTVPHSDRALKHPSDGPSGSVPLHREAAARQETSSGPTGPTGVRGPQTGNSLPGNNGSSNGNGRERLKASPLARRIAREQGIDIAALTGTGPQGRIIEADVQAFAAASTNGGTRTISAPPELGAGGPSSTAVQPGLPPAQTTPDAPQKRAASTPAPVTTPTDLSAMRKVIARRMVESKTTIPHFYITTEIDMGEAMLLREKLNAYDDSLPKISVNDMIVKASGKALAKVPAANAAFRDNKIHPGAGVHVGIAVALDDGLIVPVVRDADTLSLRKVASTAKELIGRARNMKLAPNEYSGGTFTVSNLGGFDVENFIAIIDPAQGAILAVSSIVKKAVVLDNDQIAVRPRMQVTFSGDHRVMDGATGAKFLQELKRTLQNPLSLLE